MADDNIEHIMISSDDEEPAGQPMERLTAGEADFSVDDDDPELDFLDADDSSHDDDQRMHEDEDIAGGHESDHEAPAPHPVDARQRGLFSPLPASSIDVLIVLSSTL